MAEGNCSDEEKIVKALLEETFDPETLVIDPDVFEGKDSSYSRLAIYPIDRILEIFASQLHKPPEQSVLGYAVLSVECMRKTAREYIHPESKKRVELEVLPRPECGNDSHAVTVPKVPKGLALRLLKCVVLIERWKPKTDSK